MWPEEICTKDFVIQDSSILVIYFVRCNFFLPTLARCKQKGLLPFTQIYTKFLQHYQECVIVLSICLGGHSWSSMAYKKYLTLIASFLPPQLTRILILWRTPSTWWTQEWTTKKCFTLASRSLYSKCPNNTNLGLHRIFALLAHSHLILVWWNNGQNS